MRKYFLVFIIVLFAWQNILAQTFSLVKDIWPGNGGGVFGSNEFVVWNNKLYFTAQNGAAANGNELHVSDGTEIGTYMVKDINPGSGPGGAFVLSLLNNQLIFFGRENVIAGVELYKSDGSEAGTVLLKDINPGTASSIGYTQATLNGFKYFDAYNPIYENELWKTDGTEAGTTLLKDIDPSVGGSGDPREIRKVGNLIFFYANDGIHGNEIWKSDGTEAGTTITKDIFPGLGGVQDGLEFGDLNGIAFFRKNDGINGKELWRSDGTEAGTFMVKDINAGAGNSDAFNFIVFNNNLYFIATNGVSQKLWKTDGTSAGTIALANASGTYATYGNDISKTMAVCNGFLYFPGIDAAGLELWKTDGTLAGTTMVKDINPGATSTAFRDFITVNNKVVFNATTTTNGGEPWVSDGTAGGTFMLQDIEPGTGSTSSGPFIIAGTKLFSVRTTIAAGKELWVANNFVLLPLNFLSFAAQKCNTNQVCLTWKTANEQNVSHFEIERSVDGISYTKIGNTLALNQSSNSYSYTDNNLRTTVGKYYYRIRQIDNDAKFKYSSIALINQSSKAVISIYPNPTINEVNIVGWNTIKQMQLLDITGKQLQEWNVVPSSINIGQFAKGTYVLKMGLKNGETVVQKINKQ